MWLYGRIKKKYNLINNISNDKFFLSLITIVTNNWYWIIFFILAIIVTLNRFNVLIEFETLDITLDLLKSIDN